MATMSFPNNSQGHENINGGYLGCRILKDFRGKCRAKVAEVVNKIRKVGNEDPRRIIHSLKVGLALTLVSLFYYFEPLYDSFGVNAIWAIITVVVVFEFSVGATIGKGLNRMLATLAAGFLGFGVHRLAFLSGRTAEPILIGFFVFIIAATVTFTRFFPGLKAKYDYGMAIFILTFCLVSISGYRDDELFRLARDRISTILIGSCTVVIISVCICPVWTGEDLHNLVSGNIQKLGNFLEEFGGAYFLGSEEEPTNPNMPFLQAYKTVLTSKHSEENLETLARWEPGHGRYKWRHPWKIYLKIGTLTRDCAFKIEALNTYLTSDFQAPIEIRNKIKEWCTTISSETAKALNETAKSMNLMTKTNFADPHVTLSKAAADNLKSHLKISLWEEEDDLFKVIPAASVALLLLQVVECTHNIVEAVQELGSSACFRAISQNRGVVQPFPDIDADSHRITMGSE